MRGPRNGHASGCADDDAARETHHAVRPISGLSCHKEAYRTSTRTRPAQPSCNNTLAGPPHRPPTLKVMTIRHRQRRLGAPARVSDLVLMEAGERQPGVTALRKQSIKITGCKVLELVRIKIEIREGTKGSRSIFPF